MRLFVAIQPPSEALDDLAGMVDGLRVGAAGASGVNVRLTAPEDLHLTVVFIGEVRDDQLSGVRRALDRAAGSWRPPPGTGGSVEVVGVPRLRLGGGGLFGPAADGVLWVGLRGDVDALHAVSLAARRELTGCAMAHDPRPYVPHVTLARPGRRLSPEDVEADRGALDGYLGPSWPVTELVLVRSNPPGHRRRYDHLAAWPL
ncbi:2'-5' RNA ligase [Micromonospora pisi]|uniref:RNA 2',3'-cyclic phosphodiesterase n=1 Tax=Micromonospora pisi TaxID=589240 RepID=A0A495JMG9_9ACTN|nr:RNA 2',3'-cyclic phosphodiesterase [Micromonospora pisi]RKR89855.1 2'-5' RNA ligase [Micromonospora pisi]